VLFLGTLNAPVCFEGIGVHSGEHSRISVVPLVSNASKVIFVDEKKAIDAVFNLVSDLSMCTNLSGFSTIEHLCAALHGLKITNALIKVEGKEIPILDGSSLPFVEAFLNVGVRTLSQNIKKLKILKEVKVQDGDKWVMLSPSDSFCINIECDFTAKGLVTKPFFFDFSRDDFLKEIAPARTFGFLSDVEFFKKHNLAQGASLENTVVFDDKGFPLNENGLRFPDEPIRHKILDIIGDLSLVQSEILGRFDGFCPSHKMNNMVLRKLFEEKSNYELIDE
jgi:UDP-3-O-[3-hydroxymyristoyl] N-acetylglucosamine deacetylase